MIKVVDIAAELAKLPPLRNRTPQTPQDVADAAFAMIAPFRGDGVFVGSFDGTGPWERHANGDEIVQIVSGTCTLTVLTDNDSRALDLKAGMLTVVPKGLWHRFEAPDGVAVMTVTPQPTEESAAGARGNAGSQ